MVIRTSNIIPEMREAFFKCIVCSFTTTAEVDRGRITEPTLCTNCNTNHCFTLIHNRSQFTDKQMIKLQESPGKHKTEILIEQPLKWCLFFRRYAGRTNTTYYNSFSP